MAKLAIILSIFSSLFLISLARIPIDLATEHETQIQTLLPEESNTTVLTLDTNKSTDLEILDPIKKAEEEEEEIQLSNPALPDESPEHQVVVESDPGMTSSEAIGWDPREDEEIKEEEVVMMKKKKKGKRMDDSDSDSDSDCDSDSDSDCDTDSDDEEEEEEERRKRGKKGGFFRRFLKWINIFD